MDPEQEAAVELDPVISLSKAIADLFEVHNYVVGEPEPNHILFRGRFLCDLNTCFDELRGRLETLGFTPFIRDGKNGPDLIAAPVVFEPQPSRWQINLVLLLATILSLFFVGGISFGSTSPESFILSGIQYVVSLGLILGAHELGHYFAARYHNVPVTLPYFIPFPLPPIGTMGAFIRLKAPVNNKRALFDVGAAGPLAGLVFAIPIVIIGLMTSEIGPLPEFYMLEGNSLLYGMIKLAIFGQRLPDFANNIDVSLNAIAWAGWVGLLVTGLNLIPVGQLDGGHIAYVLLGKRARWLFWPAIGGLLVLLIITRMPMWGIWILMLFVFGRQYAEPLDDVTPVDRNRRLVAIFALFLFFLVFVPNPLRSISP